MNPMPLVAGLLDGRQMVRHGLLAAIHVDAGEVGVDQLALFECRLDPSPVGVGVLIRAGDRVDADSLPCFSEALVFLWRPFEARLTKPGVGRPLLLSPFGRWLRRLFLLHLLLGIVVLDVLHVDGGI